MRVPSRSGSAWKSGDVDHRELGLDAGETSGHRSRMNMLRANRLCQARSVMTRIGMPVARVGAGVAVLDEELLALQIGS